MPAPNDSVNVSTTPVLGGASAPASGSASVRAEVSPTSAKVGDVVTLKIHVDRPLVFEVDNPVFAKELGAFEVRTSTRLPVEIRGDQATDHFIAELQAFSTGQLRLPGVDVSYRNLRDQPNRIRTPELTILIEPFPPGPHDKGDIRGIVGALGPVAWSPWWWALAAAIFVAAAFLLWRRRKRLIEGPPPPPPIPADEEALAKLRELQSSTLVATGKLKEFYSAVSETLRAYLEHGYQIPALERTTNELMRDLRRKSKIGNDPQVALKEILEACDLVKFAKFRPEAEEAQDQLKKAFAFVESTRAGLAAETPSAQSTPASSSKGSSGKITKNPEPGRPPR